MLASQELIEKYKSEMQKMATQSKVPNRDIAEEKEIQSIGQPEILSQNEKKAFPRFESDENSLAEKIVEILSQNNDVSTEQDYPVNFNDDESVTTLADDIPDILIEEIINDTPNNDEIVEENLGLNNEMPDNQTANQENQNENPQEMVSRVCIRGGQKAQYSPPANTGSAREPEGTTPPLTDTAFLRAEVFTANRAIPVANAMIRIKNAEDNSLIAVLTTNESGVTDRVELAAPDRTLSQTSSERKPYVTYFADISAEGFVPQLNLPIQMFGGADSLLPSNLIIK